MKEFKLKRRGDQPLYEQIREYIRSQILSGELPPGHLLPTASELTEKFGVSVITTNRALTELANEGLVIRIPGQGTFVANPSDLVKNGMAEVLVGVIVPNLTWPFSSGLIQHIEKQARAKGCMLLFRGTENTIESEETAIFSMIKQNVRGVILFPADNEDAPNAGVEELRKRNIPLVLVDRSFDKSSIDYVTSDNFAGGYLATKHLIQQGYERIGFVGGNYWGTSSLRDRFSGYRVALETFGRNVAYSLVFEKYGLEVPNIIEDLVEFLEGMKPDAVVCLNDRIAIDVLEAAAVLGLRVPEDLGIVGFDNTAELQGSRIPLTTVVQYWDDIASNAIRILLNKIRGAPNAFTQVEIPVELIVRESSVRR